LSLVVATGLSSGQSPSSRPDAALGERIYREGILPSGQPLRGIVEADIRVEGTDLNCASCHRRSGLGSSEGGTLVPPVTGPLLYQPRVLRQADLFSRLFEEGQPLQSRARIWHPRVRPAYTDQAVAIALREGRDPTGRELDPVMPRYLLSDEDMGHLLSYL